MSEERIKFMADDNLLKQVITDQAGDWKKGVLELMQNSYDSIIMREKKHQDPKIDIRVGQNGDEYFLEVEDVGCGMGKTKEEVIRNMQIFGNSIKKNIEGTIGEKGMGRGQAMAMIYDIARNEFVGDIIIQTNGWELYDIKLRDLSFSIRKAEYDGWRPIKRKGTRWIIKSTFRQFEANEISEYVEENIMLPITIAVNGKAIVKKLTGWKWETETAVYYAVQGLGSFRVYDRGMYVRSIRFGGIGGSVVTKVPLKLNFARNDVIDSDPHWRTINKEVVGVVKAYLASSDGMINPEKRTAIKELISRMPGCAEDYADVPIIMTAQGKWITPNQLREYGKAYTSDKGNRLADDLLCRGAMVLSEGYGELAAKFGMRVEALSTSHDLIVESAKRSRFCEYGIFDENITDKDRTYMKTLVKISPDRKLVFGRHKGFNAWTDGSSYICFDITTFRNWTKGNPSTIIFYLRAMHTLAHELAHDSDNRETDIHGHCFEQEHLNWMKVLLQRAEVEITSVKKE
jgi:hypothetical protein